MSSSTITTISVAASSVPSIPLNELAESAALPRGPAICVARPFARALAMLRRAVTAAGAPFQPFEPRSTGTIVSIALPSLAKIGPVTCPCTTPATCANRAASVTAFARSALVRPDGRSYTTTPVKISGDWNRDCRARTLVDSALAGSQAEESFFSAPVSLPASGPATATTISQKTRTAHLVRRPVRTPAITCNLPTSCSPFWAVDVHGLARFRSYGGPVLRGRYEPGLPWGVTRQCRWRWKVSRPDRHDGAAGLVAGPDR